MTHTLGDAPVEPQYIEKLQAIMHAVDEFLNGKNKGKARKTGIVIMMFPFGNVDGRCNFMSNGADRNDLVTLFKEMIARFEGQPEIKSTSKQ